MTVYTSQQPMRRLISAELRRLTAEHGRRLPVTNAELAERCGCSMRSVIRVLNQMAAEGLIRKRVGSIVVLRSEALR